MTTRFNNILLIIFLFLYLPVVHGQDSHDTTFKKKGEIGFFLGPVAEVSNIDFDTRLFYGGHAALGFGNTFIGTYALFTPSFNIEDEQSRQYEMSLGYGGLWLSYSPLVEFPLHPYFGFKTAWGTATVKDDLKEEKHKINVVQPEFGLSIIFNNFSRVVLTGGYKWINKLEKTGLVEGEDTHGMVFCIGLQFGRF